MLTTASPGPGSGTRTVRISTGSFADLATTPRTSVVTASSFRRRDRPWTEHTFDRTGSPKFQVRVGSGSPGQSGGNPERTGAFESLGSVADLLDRVFGAV